MRRQEIAAVKVAVKRSVRAKTAECGFLHLAEWITKHPDCDSELVMKCFRKWVRRRSNEIRN